MNRLLISLPLTVSFVACGGGEGSLPAQVCYAQLPDNAERKPSKDWIATPTRPGPYTDGAVVIEQFEIADAKHLEAVEGLLEDALASWSGIAYNPSRADPAAPDEEWDLDAVYDVTLSASLPAEVPADHFEPDDGRMIYAIVDLGVVDQGAGLSMVLAEQGCERLIPAANGAFDAALLQSVRDGSEAE